MRMLNSYHCSKMFGSLMLVTCFGLFSCNKAEEATDENAPISRDSWVRFREPSSFGDPKWKALEEPLFIRVSSVRRDAALRALESKELKSLTAEEALSFAPTDAHFGGGGGNQCYLVRAVSFRDSRCRFSVVLDEDSLVTSCAILGSARTLNRDALVVCPKNRPENLYVEFSIVK